MINMVTMKVDGAETIAQIDPTDLEAMQLAVGGFIETVPGFRMYVVPDGTTQSGVAFCNEEGKLKSLPVNHLATANWHRNFPTNDVLVGDVIFLYGGS